MKLPQDPSRCRSDWIGFSGGLPQAGPYVGSFKYRGDLRRSVGQGLPASTFFQMGRVLFSARPLVVAAAVPSLLVRRSPRLAAHRWPSVIKLLPYTRAL